MCSTNHAPQISARWVTDRRIWAAAVSWRSICFFCTAKPLGFAFDSLRFAMKKTTKVVKKALTPATKPVKTVIKTTPVPAAKVKPTVVVTTISANVDVGFGNALYVRGEGPGLSWEKGMRMECVSDDRWSLSLGESTRPFVFKFLINDETWSLGDDYTVAPGTQVTLTPAFSGV